MSDPKECNWCRQKKTPAEGRWDNGRWICYECFPNNTILLDKAQKCKVCHHRSNQGIIDGTKFVCSTCVPNQRKPSKKKKWENGAPSESTSKKAKKEKARQRKHQELEAARLEAERLADEKRRTRWVVTITDISTGDL